MAKVEYIIEMKDQFSGVLKKVGDEVGRTDKKISALSGIGAKLGGVFAAIGIGSVAKSIFDMGVQAEQTQIAFGTFLGDMDKGKKLFSELSKFADITPFNDAEVIASGRAILSAGIAADKVTETLRIVGDVAAGTSQPLNEMANIYAKAMNKGRVQAEELNQLAERGVPILDEFSKMFGKTKAEVLKMGEKGQLTSELLTTAFRRMSSEGGIFFNLMEKQSRTTGGLLSTLVGQMQKVGIVVFNKMKPAIDKLIVSFLKVGEWIGKNINTIIDLISVIIKVARYYVYFKVGLIAANIAIKAQEYVVKGLGIVTDVLTGKIKKAITAQQLMKATSGVLALAIGVITEKYMKFKAAQEQIEQATSRMNEKTKDLKATLSGYTDIVLKMNNISKMSGSDQSNLAGVLEEQIKKYEELSKVAEGIQDKSKLPVQNQGYIDMSGKYVQSAERLKELNEELTKSRPQLFGYSKKEILDRTSQLRTYLLQLNKAGLAQGGTTTLETETKSEKITSSAPKVFNINIGNLVEQLTISSSNIQEGAKDLEQIIVKALLAGINDTQMMQTNG